MSTKYQPTRDDVLAAFASERHGAMTLPDIRRAIQKARDLPTTYAQSRKWATDVAVNPISDTTLRRVLEELIAEGVAMAFGVGEDPAVSAPYGANVNSTLYLTAEDYRHRRAEWEDAQAQRQREQAEAAALKKAQLTVLEKHADEVARLAEGFLRVDSAEAKES